MQGWAGKPLHWGRPPHLPGTRTAMGAAAWLGALLAIAATGLIGPGIGWPLLTTLAVLLAAGAAAVYVSYRAPQEAPGLHLAAAALTALVAAAVHVSGGGPGGFGLAYAALTAYLAFTHGALLALFAGLGATLHLVGTLVPVPGALATTGVTLVTIWASVPLAARVLALCQDALQQQRHLSTLLASTAILTGVEVEETLENTARQVLAATGADLCAILMADPARQVLRPRVIRFGPHAFDPGELEAWQAVTVRYGEGMTGWVAVHRQPILTGDAERDPRAKHLPGTPVVDESALLVPMVVEDRLLGVIRATRHGLHRFATEDLQVLQVLAGNAAVAINHARLYDEARALAVTDPLTGLYNRHYFNIAIEPQLEAAGTADRRIGVLMIDIYDFKKVNDTWGHAAGDTLLQHTARLLRQQVRGSDIVVRYGGDEFVVVMPDGGPTEAEAVKHRIEQAVAAFNAGRTPDEPPLTLNIGVEAARGSDLAHILSRADAAMYEAKRSEDRRRLAELVEAYTHEREKHAVQAVLALAKVLELQDPYSRGRTQRERRLATAIARELGMTPEAVNRVGFAAVLHDVGKIAIAPEVLNKPGALAPDELALIRRHPELAANIVSQLDVLADLAPMILHHHERWDGAAAGPFPGYPAGLRGEEIPPGARILHVVDAYEAMTSDRPWRPALTAAAAAAELQQGAGAQFDPEAADAALRVLAAMGVRVEA